MSQRTLWDSVELLKIIRAELLDKVENSIIADMDMAISEIEEYLLSNSQKHDIDTNVFLQKFGKVIQYIPFIAEMIKYLMKHIDNG